MIKIPELSKLKLKKLGLFKRYIEDWRDVRLFKSSPQLQYKIRYKNSDVTAQLTTKKSEMVMSKQQPSSINS